jgi:succinoglycan biosynthesis transport protein ExoP
MNKDTITSLVSGTPLALSSAAQPYPHEQAEWLSTVRAIRRHWLWSLVFAGAFSLCVVVTVLLMKPVYQPTARIEVDPPGNELFSLEPGSPSDSIAYAETQAKNLETDELAIAVIRKLQLDRNPEFVRRPLKAGQSNPLPVSSSARPAEVTPTEQIALKVFRRSLQVHRDTSSWLIDVSFASHDPQLAALVTNTLVEQFIETNYQTRHEAIVQSTQWLSHQLDDIRARMEQSNKALTDFQKHFGITPVGNTQSTFDERMSELNRQLTVAQADRIQLEALLQKVDGADPESDPHATADPVVQELSKRLGAARTELKQAVILYGENHPKIKELQAQVEELQAQLDSQRNNVLGDLKTSYAAANVREGLLQSQLKEASKELGHMAQYEALKKEALASEALYNTLYTRVKEAGISAESKSSNVRWIDRAGVLDTPSRPRPLLDIAMGTLAGILGGFLLAFVRASLDSRVRTLEDMKRLTGSSISLLPLIGAENGDWRKTLRGEVWRNGNGNFSEAFLLERPGSAEAEALLGLFTCVRLSDPCREPRVLLVTSGAAAEGKTTIAVNLGIALARHGKTCVLDADMRKPRVAGIFGFECQYGLADVLNGSCRLDEAFLAVPNVPNLNLLPAGLARHDAGELICAEAMRDLLGKLRQEFQFVVIDSSPILPFVDGRALAPLADGVIFVGRSGVTTREAIKRSLELLAQARSSPVLTVVLNAVDFSSPEYRYGYAYK